MITTDNTCDLPQEYLKEHEVPTMSLTYILDGKTYTEENSCPIRIFIKKCVKDVCRLLPR